MDAIVYKRGCGYSYVFVLLLTLLCLGTGARTAQASIPNSACFEGCHDDEELTGERRGREFQAFINLPKFKSSAHTKVKCVECHSDLADEAIDDLHEDDLEPVNCGSSGCHATVSAQHDRSLHGKAIREGDPLAPHCQDCHGAPHYIVSRDHPNSPFQPLNVPFLCGKCHQEGTNVMKRRVIHQDHIIENYSESIHGEGLLRKGLVVAPNCASCHTAHNILPHTDPKSSIAKANISKTCTQCHAMIESVHQKVIKGELWEKQDHVLPACVDCHQPHKVRRAYYTLSVADKDCMGCHEDPELKAESDGRPLFVDAAEHDDSRHNKVACSQCHAEVTPSKTERQCSTIKSKVDCSSCHSEVGNQYMTSTHGQLVKDKDPNGPTCKECHGTHKVLGREDPGSPTFVSNIPKLCATCHREGEKAAKRYTGLQRDIVEHYQESIHAKGLNQSGLIVAAVCTSCHTAHGVLPRNDPASSVNPRNVANTCGNCHYGVEQMFQHSVHSASANGTTKALPVCADCHSAHTINEPSRDPFRLAGDNTCGGTCHKKELSTYYDTFHGKAIILGRPDVATCFDCHGHHDITPVTAATSVVGPEQRIETCRKCHEGANVKFASYLVHADYKDEEHHPELYWTYVAMTALLLGTFGFFAIHTLLWLYRTARVYAANPSAFRAQKEKERTDKESFVRFRPFDRFLHGLVIVSFLTLVITGMPLKFPTAGWARVLLDVLGGQEFASVLHRLGAIITGFYFTGHLASVVSRLFKGREEFRNPETGAFEGKRLLKKLIGPDSPVPNAQDAKDLIAHMRWFVSGGERPQFDRWTYWEKFDYMAVFWGVTMIGLSGLIMWFPVFFTQLLPGWAINVALIIHSDEALLAAGFIFTFHFFNVHLRPEKFPIDSVIFSGRISKSEMLHERKRQYDRLAAEGKLEKQQWSDEWDSWKRIVLPVGMLAWGTGFVLVILIFYALFWHH